MFHFLENLISDAYAFQKCKLSIMLWYQNGDISYQNKTGRYKMTFKIDTSDDDAIQKFKKI